MQWNATLYDNQHAFVSKYGEALIEILAPQAGEKILDLGCGTGDLAHQISLSGCQVIGVDAAQEMVDEAKAKYPSIDFVCDDACNFDLGKKMDAVFSNAVLHWIRQPETILDRVVAHLRKKGRFVAEFGAKGNVEKIRNTIREVLKGHGYHDQAAIQKWYFPSVAEYSTLLEKHGFDIRFIESYNRPTVLKNSEAGIIEWLEMFAASFFKGISEQEKQKLLHVIQDRLYDDLYQNGEWVADYKRLRFCAIKN